MKDEKTYHVVHDENGNIRSIVVSTSGVGARAMIAPAPGCSVTQVKVEDLNLKFDNEEDAKQVREVMKQHRVDTSVAGSLIKRSPKQK